jgi:membrane associated rhomboid family serine protease
VDRILARLERRLGKLTIQRLTVVLVFGTGIVFLLGMIPDRNVIDLLSLDFARILEGQVWRLVTFAFIPPSKSYIWILFDLYWLWLLGSNLENAWGAFKFNAYYFIGMLGTIGAAAILHFTLGSSAGITNTWLNFSLVFAFATLFPDYQILMFFILPVKMKWLGFLTAAFLVYEAAVGGWEIRAAIGVSFANYFLFFTGHLVALSRGRAIVVRQAARRAAIREADVGAPVIGRRVCAMCGKREEDGADIRVCNCDKCGGVSRNLCLEHARNH